MQVVELEEGAAAPPESQARAPRRRWLLAAGAAAVVATLLGVQHVLDERGRREAARVAALPGAIDALGDSLDVLWQVDRRDQAAVRHDSRADGAFVSMRDESDGGVTLVALDEDSGRVRWSRTVLAPDEGRAFLGPSIVPQACRPAPSVSARAVACLVSDGFVFRSTGTGPVRSAAEAPRLLVVDARDGATLAQVGLPAGTADVAVVGDAAVAVVQRPAWHVVAVGVDLASGAERWRLDPPGQRSTGSVQSGADAAVEPAGAFALVREPSPSSRVTLVDDEGAIVSGPTSRWASWQVVGGALWAQDGAGDRGTRTLVFAADGSTRSYPGRLLTRRVDDGSVPYRLFTDAVAIEGLDGETGRSQWARRGSASSGVVVLAGRVYVPTWEPMLVALDAMTGERLWGVQTAPNRVPGSPTTDGTHLVVIQRTGTGVAPYVSVYDPADGRETARLLPPDDVSVLDVRGRHLVGVGTGGRMLVLG